MMKVFYPALLSLAAAAQAATIPPKTVELGGTALFQHVQRDGSDATLIGFGPEVHFYPASNFFLGPVVQLAYQWTSESSYSQQEIGAEFGGISSAGSDDLHFYAGAGASFVRVASSFEFLDVDEEESETGYGLEAFAGLKFRLGANFCLNVQPTYHFMSIDGDNLNSYNIRFGFSGFLFPRSAASQP